MYLRTQNNSQPVCLQIVKNILWRGWKSASDVFTPRGFLPRSRARYSMESVGEEPVNKLAMLHKETCSQILLCATLVEEATTSLQVRNSISHVPPVTLLCLVTFNSAGMVTPTKRVCRSFILQHYSSTVLSRG